MSPETIKQHLESKPFRPLRFHLASGNSIDVTDGGIAWGLRHSLMVLHPKVPGGKMVDRYSEINYRLIERVEQLPDE